MITTPKTLMLIMEAALVPLGVAPVVVLVVLAPVFKLHVWLRSKEKKERKK